MAMMPIGPVFGNRKWASGLSEVPASSELHISLRARHSELADAAMQAS